MSAEAAVADPGHAADDHGHDPHATTTGLSHTKLAMWVFLGSECLLFGGLISTYLLYKSRGNGRTLPTDVFDIPFTSVSVRGLPSPPTRPAAPSSP